MRVAVLIVVLAGCDQLFKLEHLPPSPIDGAIDSSIDAPAPHACTGRSQPPLYCADFDEPGPQVFAPAGPMMFPTSAPGAMAELRSPSTTGSQALWITSTGGDLFATYSSPAPAVYQLHATFALKIIPPVNSTSGLFRLTLSDGTTTCYVNLELYAPSTLELQGFCPDNEYRPIVMQLPTDWFTVDLTLDRKLGEASITVGQTGPLQLFFSGPHVMAGTKIQLGIDGQGNDGLAVGYDDITVTGS